MPEKLCIQVRAPKGSFPGEVEYGYYVVEGGKVTLTDGNGTPLSDGGRQYSHQLRDGENPRIRAVLLSRLRHRNASPRGFNRRARPPFNRGAGSRLAAPLCMAFTNSHDIRIVSSKRD